MKISKKEVIDYFEKKKNEKNILCKLCHKYEILYITERQSF